MGKYGIAHNAGNYQVVLVEMEAGFSAHIFDAGHNCVTVLHAHNEDATYDACMRWASANIRGEFQLITLAMPSVSQDMKAVA